MDGRPRPLPHIYDPSGTPRQLARVDVPGQPYGITYDPVRDRLWVAASGLNQVIGYDMTQPTPREVARIPTVRQPNTVAVVPSSGRVFVTGTDEGTVETTNVPEIDHYTQARNVAEIEAMARDLIATLRGLDPTDIALDIDIDIALPDDVRQRLDQAARLREQEAQMRRAAADNVRVAATSLHRSGIPLRDIGKLLGVSFQRAGQLVRGDGDSAHRA